MELIKLVEIHDLLYVINATTLETVNTSNNYGSQFVYLILTFGVFVFFAVLSAKWVSSAKNSSVPGKNMKIIETRVISPGTTLQIVKIGKKYVLLGATKENVSFLADIDEENIMESENKTKNPFEDVFLKISKNPKSSNDVTNEKNEEKLSDNIDSEGDK